MLGIAMNFDILARLKPQKSTIICYDMKHIIRKKKKKIQNLRGARPNP